METITKYRRYAQPMGWFAILCCMLAFSCNNGKELVVVADFDTADEIAYRTIGFIERFSKEMDAVVPVGTKIEVIAEGLAWAEGPLWIPERNWLLCSDVKENKIYKWQEGQDLEVFLEPSGFTGVQTDSREKGSNGLTLDVEGNLVVCQHGNRQVARMKGTLDAPSAEYEVLADSFDGWRLNSPNDLIYDSKGNLYFTDPPFGLSEKMMGDPNKELPFQGVYKLDTTGNLSLVTNMISKPGGLALSPDESELYVTNTDAKDPCWMVYDIYEDGTIGKGFEFYNAKALIGNEVGYPDGIKVNDKGYIFTAGPGGLWIFNPDLKLIGKIKPNKWVSNCAFDESYQTLYITADDYVLRLKLKTS